VECKLRANPEIRRHVIGQILAYAATLWELGYEAFDHAFAARAQQSLVHSVQAIAGDDWDEEAFRITVADNLAAGRFRLVIAVDEITDELRRIVRFLNSHTTPELDVLALELRYVADSGVEILIPTTYGEEGVAAKKTAQPAKSWDEGRFFERIATNTSIEGQERARRLIRFASEQGVSLAWGVGPFASVTARFAMGAKLVSLYSLYEGYADGTRLAINFEYLVGNVSDELIAAFAATIRSISGWATPLATLETKAFRQRPSLPIASLPTDASIEAFERAVVQLLATAASSGTLK
jgi:hypothetical protein